MKTLSAVIVLAAMLALPAGAVAKPDASDKRAAIAQCKSERGKSKATRRAFKAKYHDFSRCVRQNAAEEHAERKAARRQAVKECKGQKPFGKCVAARMRALKAEADEADEQDVAEFKNAAKECQAESDDAGFPAAHDGKSFSDFYGTNKNHRNAFGKCVSGKQHEEHYVDPFEDEDGGQGNGHKKHDHPHDA
jgi:hypothetical protein